MKVRFTHASERQANELEELFRFAYEQTGGIAGSLAVRFANADKQRNGKTRGYSGVAADRRLHGIQRWARRARFSIAVKIPTDDYEWWGEPHISGHAAHHEQRDAIRDAHERGETRFGRWPILVVWDWRETVVLVAAHELYHVLGWDRGRDGAPEVACEEFAARVLTTWRDGGTGALAATYGPDGGPEVRSESGSTDHLTNATASPMIQETANPEPQEAPMTKTTKIPRNIDALRQAYLVTFRTFATDRSEIAAALGITKENASRLLKTLEERNLVGSVDVNDEAQGSGRRGQYRELTWQCNETYDSIAESQATYLFDLAFGLVTEEPEDVPDADEEERKSDAAFAEANAEWAARNPEEDAPHGWHVIDRRDGERVAGGFKDCAAAEAWIEKTDRRGSGEFEARENVAPTTETLEEAIERGLHAGLKPIGDITTAAGRRANSEARQALRALTLVAKTDGKTPWHVPADDTQNPHTLCGLPFVEGNWHVEDDVDGRVVKHKGRTVCGNCLTQVQRAARAADNTTTEEVTMSSSTAQVQPDDKKTQAAGRTAAAKASDKPAAETQVSPTDLVKTLTAEVRKAVTGVKVEPGPGGVRTYYRIKVEGKAKTLGFARAGDRKAAVQVGSEAREELTEANLAKVVTKMSKRADAIKKEAKA